MAKKILQMSVPVPIRQVSKGHFERVQGVDVSLLMKKAMNASSIQEMKAK